MRLSWVSNAPWAPTGYGTQTAQACSRIKADGHDVGILANHGVMGAPVSWRGIPVYPGGAHHYSTDVIDREHELHMDGEDGWMVTLYDVWVFEEALTTERVISWTPVDHETVPPIVARWARSHRTIAMSRFGEEALRREGISSVYVPHGIDRSVYRPRPSGFRRMLGVPDDAFLVTIAAANSGVDPSRKAWPQMLDAWATFSRRHPDAYLYLHTDLSAPRGIRLRALLAVLGADPGRIRGVDPVGYRIGAIAAETVAEAYTASDVLLATSMGEGFGLAVPEAMACGTPAIVTDFSAQPEIVGDVGWRVRWQRHYDQAQGAHFAMPLVDDVVARLDDAYDARGDAGVRAAAMARAAAYDADLVYDLHWRPLLAEMGAALPARVAA